MLPSTNGAVLPAGVFSVIAAETKSRHSMLLDASVVTLCKSAFARAANGFSSR